MKTPILALVVAAFVSIASGSVSLTDPQKSALTPIDSVPSRVDLTAIFNGELSAFQSLEDIAQDTTGAADPGIRLRAIHALGKYCPLATVEPRPPCSDLDPGYGAHTALAAIITANSGEKSGTGLLLLRAAIEALGPLRVGGDVSPMLSDLLNHQSRDIRAAAARAMRDVCDTTAIPFLRGRLAIEHVDQVRLAISDALRSLPCQ